MRRRKKSTRPALVQSQAHGDTAPNVQKDLARIFGEPEPADGEPEPPLALPLAAAPATTVPGAAPAATATTTAGPQKNATKHADEGEYTDCPHTRTRAACNASALATLAHAGQRASAPASAPLNPIGHAHETDKIARDHAQHPHQHAPSATGSPNTQVHVHEEHAPPMVAAEGPHAHDQAVHAEDKPVSDTPSATPQFFQYFKNETFQNKT